MNDFDAQKIDDILKKARKPRTAKEDLRANDFMISAATVNEKMMGIFAGCYKMIDPNTPIPAIAQTLMSSKNLNLADYKLFMFCDDEYNKDLPVFQTKDGVVIRISDDWMESHISEETMLGQHKARELWACMKKVLFDRSTNKKSDVKPVGFADSQGLYWNKISISRADIEKVPITLSDLPEFSEFLDLFVTEEDRRAFVLFCGSLFDNESSRFQYLHLYGEGGEGKSTFTQVLKSLFTEKTMVSIRSGDIEDRFFGENLEGKRLLLFEDENNPGFMQSGAFKRITGENSMTIEPKYKKPRSIRIDFKTLITSNNLIHIGADNADRRRVISVKLNRVQANRDPINWQKNFLASGEKIAAYLIQEYEREVAADPIIRVTIPAPLANTEDAVQRNYEEWKDLMHSAGLSVTKNPSDKITTSEAHTRLQKALGKPLSNKQRSDFKKYATDKGVVVVTIKGHDYYKGLFAAP